MAGRARVRNLVFVCHRRRDELEGVGTHEGSGYALSFDLRHVAGYALTAGAAILVMGVLLQSRRVRTIG